MIYNAKVHSVDLPRHDIDPQLKTQQDWHLQVAKYIYNYHGGSWLAKRQLMFNTLRAYAEGNQSTDQYKSIFIGQDSTGESTNAATEYSPSGGSDYYSMANHRMGFVNIDFDKIFSPAPNLLTTLEGIMSNQKHTIKAYAVDRNSNDERKAIEYRLRAKMVFKEMYDSFAVLAGGEQQEVLPSTLEELKMYGMLGGFMLPYETAIQEIITYTLDHESASDDLKSDAIRDLAVLAMAAGQDIVDQYSQRVGVRYLDPARLIVQYNNDTRRFKDAQFWGYQEYMSIYEIRAKTGWDENRIWKIANHFKNVTSLGNTVDSMDSVETFQSTGNANYNDIRVTVLYYEYLTIDSIYYTDVKSETSGNFRVEEPYRNHGKKAPKEYTKENRKTFKNDIHTWYSGYWIMGMDEVFGHGKKLDQAFDYKIKEPKCSLHFYVMRGPSLIEQILSVLDDIQMMYLRFQNDIATSPPTNGVAVELGSLNELKMGGKKLHPFDTLKIRTQTGIMFYSLHRAPIPGSHEPFNNVLPFQDMRGGIGAAIADFVNGITSSYQQLAALTGIDRMTLSSFTPTGEHTATQIKYATANTKDSLKPLYSGWVKVHESLATSIAIQAQQLIAQSKGDCGYTGILSRAKIEAVRMAGSTPPAEYGIEILAMPTDDEIAQIVQAAQAATMGGKNGIPALSWSEYLFVYDALKNGTPIQYVIAYISYKEKMRDQQAAAISAQAQEMDTQKGIAIAKAKEESEINIIKAKGDAEARTEVIKGLVDIMVKKQSSEEELKRMALEMGFEIGKTTTEMQGNQQQMQPQQQQEAMPEESPLPPM